MCVPSPLSTTFTGSTRPKGRDEHSEELSGLPYTPPWAGFKNDHIHPQELLVSTDEEHKGKQATIRGLRNHRRRDPQFMVAEMTPRDTIGLLLAEVHSVSPRV